MWKSVQTYLLKTVVSSLAFTRVVRSLKKKKYDVKIMLSTLSKETFTQDIGLNSNPNSFYTINWDIDHLNTLIKKYHLKPQTYPIESIVKRLSAGSVPYVDESVPLRNDPIYAVEYPLITELPNLIIVDGNYRTIRKYLRNDTEIDVYVIPPHIHMIAMLDEMSVVAYKIHNNCFHIIRYMTGQVPEMKELKKLLFRF